MVRRMMLTALEGIPSVMPGDDLVALVVEACKRSDLALEDGDVIVLAQKIVSKTEGRSVDLRDVVPSPKARELAEVAQKDPRVVELILRESISVLRCRLGVIIVEHRSGLVMANAGIDASNVDGAAGDERVLLLPEDADRTASALRDNFKSCLGRDIGVVINDSLEGRGATAR